MHLADIDHLSVNGNSILHRCKVISKLILVLSFLTSFLITSDLTTLLGLIIIQVLFFVVGKIPIKKVIHLAIYPVFFSLLFALIMGRNEWTIAFVIILRALGAALTMLMLITTTPYVDLFATLSFVMPSILVDIFLVTYRSFFILIDKVERLLKNMKLRGGYSSLNVFKNLKSIAGTIGVLIIHSFDMSERMYKIYALRGYNGKIPIEASVFPLHKVDYMVIMMGILIFVGTVIPWNL
ncbi:energy-coupling factor transporter transmembrane component T [Serpentinicella sp. ANB-PHB4]|uniref:energy-coupling factor transporter transmembrane component T family protein n=1 Tax=Serpentinicella sp. ANB-PHB4 TaxID=3074076 RepID=UPI002859F0EC|nr:energy-coupling factor transporter transmembrane component T [Serpentinicella sp. ANB-PHB4]MDR5658631.1 energy-coupling factor transporter transmembrane component T [Serpentinicella sp. ANB-PHB4]